MSDSKTFKVNNLELELIKNNDVIIIVCLDKILHKSYKEQYTKEMIKHNFSIDNLDNFYQIITYSFENYTYLLISELEAINIKINFDRIGLKFNFTLILNLNDQPQLNANSLYIDKLQIKIQELEENTLINLGTTYSGGSQMPIIVNKKINKLIIKDNVICNKKSFSSRTYFTDNIDIIQSTILQNGKFFKTIVVKVPHNNGHMYKVSVEILKLEFDEIEFESNVCDETKDFFLNLKKYQHYITWQT